MIDQHAAVVRTSGGFFFAAGFVVVGVGVVGGMIGGAVLMLGRALSFVHTSGGTSHCRMVGMVHRVER